MADLRRKEHFDLLTGLSSSDDAPSQGPQIEDEEQKRAQEEYERWLEEGLKTDKGYGQKVSYEDHDPLEDGDSYAGSTWEAYAKQQAEAQAQIRKLKEKDAERKARDEAVFHSLSAISILRHGTYIGDNDFFMKRVAALLWYGIFAGSLVGLFFAAGARGADLWVLAGIGGVVGALVRYNGKEGYPLHLAIERGTVEIGILIAIILCWVANIFVKVNLYEVVAASTLFACVSAYIREKVFYARPKKEAFFTSLHYLSILLVVFLIALGEVLLDSQKQVQ